MILFFFLFFSVPARADFWGADLPLLAEIVANTLETLNQMRVQTKILKDEMGGINDKIERIKTISEIIDPASWSEWRRPEEALKRLQMIYLTLPKEYRSKKSDEIEEEISRAMNLIARVMPEAKTSFSSGKELERRGADASPGVAEKLTASGMGSLIAMEAQTQVIESHITGLLARMLADASEKEARSIVMKGESFSIFSENLKASDGKFSTHILLKETFK